MNSRLQKLIAELKSEGRLANRRLLKAFKRVDRADFVLPNYKEAAYENYPLPIGYGQTISQPYTVAFMLELLDVKPGDKILEIGCGSGWVTALLCFLAGPKGRVVAIERIPSLIKLARRHLSRYPLLYRTSTLVCKDGAIGCAKAESFDKIIASAAAKKIPNAWKQQLKLGGKIVAPVKDSIVEIIKKPRKVFKTVKHPGFIFVPLVKGS